VKSKGFCANLKIFPGPKSEKILIVLLISTES
jgi:hypothetical protein